MDEKIKDMRRESKTMTPNILIGKNGLSDQVLKNIKTELSKHKLVKLKILKSLISETDKNAIFAEIEEKSGAKVVQKIGFTITLTKR